MFHEVSFPVESGASCKHNFLGHMNRLMARIIHRGAKRSFVSIPAWGELLQRLAPGSTPIQWLPVPSNLPTKADSGRVAQFRRRLEPQANGIVFGHFGTYSSPIRSLLLAILPPLLTSSESSRVFLIGRNSEVFAAELMRAHPVFKHRLVSTGALSAEETTAALAASDVLIQPYPDGASTRRTSLMAGLALGLPVVTTDGVATEGIWRDSAAVALAPVEDPAALVCCAIGLAGDSAAQARLGRVAHAMYRRHFEIERVVQTLRSS